jgi:hypothetical protein
MSMPRRLEACRKARGWQTKYSINATPKHQKLFNLAIYSYVYSLMKLGGDHGGGVAKRRVRILLTTDCTKAKFCCWIELTVCRLALPHSQPRERVSKLELPRALDSIFMH